MVILGSTTGATCDDYISNDDKGIRRILPHVNSKCHTGMKGCDTLRKECLIEILQKADDVTHQYATK